MSRLQSIENALTAINETVFQELCDSFLALRNNNYTIFSRTGSQSGKQKTVKGTPDTFLYLPNGKFIFVEYSTNISARLSKLKDDVKKCIDTEKTGIPLDQILEIILCINFNLSTDEVQSLKNLLVNTRIALTIYTLDSLAIELHLHHRDLTHQYLGIPLDTGQIVSVDKFIEEYNRASKGISTHLDNTFLHREQELTTLKEFIYNNDFIILTGAAGIGKTKLALEGIKSYLSENLSFGAYCVSYKNHTLLDDLYQYFDSKKDYLLFIDDANRIDAFSQITGFYRATRKGKLKILITVRDYAFQDIGILCQEFSPIRLDLVKFSDDQIVDIIKVNPFDILNSDYHKEIVRIADGNPRIAIMTALLAKAEQNIYALHNVSDLFENYFSTFIKDDGEFAKPLNIQCLGLISFFYTIPYKEREISASILENFNIKYSAFIDAIDKLEKLELVEIQFEHVKIPEQNLSTYFFYKAFIKDSLLDFEILINKYFEDNNFRFRDTVIPAYNMMGGIQIENQLKPKLLNHLRIIRDSENKVFEFLDIFWYLLSDETIEFIYELVDSLPTVTSAVFKVTYVNNQFSTNKNNVIELIGEFFRFPNNNFKDAVELAFEYTRKIPEHLPELIHKIREQTTFDRDDERSGFVRQIILFQILIDGLNKSDILFSNVFYELSKTFLLFKFEHTEGGRNHNFYWYSYPIPNITQIQQFRKRIWEVLETKFEIYPSNSFELLQTYARISPDVIRDVMEFDVPLVVGIIEKHLTPNSFEHCKYVQDQIRWCERNSVSNPSFKSQADIFRNPTYEIFLKIDWDRLRDKGMYDFENHKEYENLKETEIRNSFVFRDINEINNFYDSYVYLEDKIENNWNYNNVLDFILDENFNKNFDIGIIFLEKIIKNDNKINFIPRIAFNNHLNNKQKSDKIWSIIEGYEFSGKYQWEQSFYDFLDESLINKIYIPKILVTFTNINKSTTIYFDRLEKYLSFDPKLFQKVLNIITEKNKKGAISIRVWTDFFNSQFDHLVSNFHLLKESYLQQYNLQEVFDYKGKAFIQILKIEPDFLITFVKYLYLVSNRLAGHHFSLGFIWNVNGIEKQIIEVIELVLKKEVHLGILVHFANSFYRDIEEKNIDMAVSFLKDFVRSYNNDSDKMNVVVDITRHFKKDLFDEILLLFLSMNHNIEIFKKIYWIGSGGTYSGDVIIGDEEAAKWRNILSIVEKSDIGLKLIPIKQYINSRIESCLKSADFERKRKFLGNDW